MASSGFQLMRCYKKYLTLIALQMFPAVLYSPSFINPRLSPYFIFKLLTFLSEVWPVFLLSVGTLVFQESAGGLVLWILFFKNILYLSLMSDFKRCRLESCLIYLHMIVIM
jgi:hypothetical protein